MSDQLKNQLRHDLGAVREQVQKLQVHNMARENDMMKRKMAMQGSGQGPAYGKLPFWMAPGNVGECNQVIWPFYFSTPYQLVAEDQQVQAGFSVTQEAAFVIMEISKAVFTRVNNGGVISYQYINPDDPGAAGFTPGLQIQFIDNTTTRTFNNNPLSLDHIGNPRFPHQLATPMMLIPRANFGVIFTNTNPATYMVRLSFFGYRIRIQDSDKIKSLATQSLKG